MSNLIIPRTGEWTFQTLEKLERKAGEIARSFGLDFYPIQIEIITAEQMMDAYSSVGMPVGYAHWSYGKHFIVTEQIYRRGQMGLAYEIVINSDPCIVYLMEENTATMQALVIAHACYGHNSFFKGNYLFRTWSSADSIIEYLLFAKRYISNCEEKYGEEKVELLLDSCHALMNYGVDRYKRPPPLSSEKEAMRAKSLIEYFQGQIDPVADTTVPKRVEKRRKERARNLERFINDPGLTRDKIREHLPNENILYVIEKTSPTLEPWQREVVRIVRKIAQYFYPQRQTQVMNEGWACFWHYTIMYEMYNMGHIDEGSMQEFLISHTNVIYQPPFDDPHYSGINPYNLGFNMFMDIKRICEHPTDEDKEWFPDIAGSNSRKTLDFIMRNFRDESFIGQFLSPKIIRDLKLFSVVDDDEENELEIGAIHDSWGYGQVRRALSEQYDLGSREPNLEVTDIRIKDPDRKLIITHWRHNRKPLHASNTMEVAKHIHRLWGYPVEISSVEADGRVMDTIEIPEEEEKKD